MRLATRLACSIVFTALLMPTTVFGEQILHMVSPDGKTETWNIFEPVVSQPTSEYPQIRFLPGDSIHVDAGGCVQTGGHGLTWKRYVNPSGQNSDRFYYGTMWIPGVVGDSASVQKRFIDINGANQFGVTASINTAQAYLRLGYIDDSYSDNGYLKPDAGTENQCLNVPHASVRITIVHGAGTGIVNPTDPTPLPFDLLSDAYDDNLIPLNPYWGYQKLHNGLPPSAEKLCEKDIPVGMAEEVEYFPDQMPCTRQPTSRDDAHICGPHGNWGPATVVGSIVWESHSTGTFSGDDDYSWYLTPPNGNGLTATRTTMEPEFKAAETIDHFSTPWWSDFHLAVDQGGTGPNTLVDGKLAIVSGLFSLDFEHSIHSEIHPVFAMAIRVKEDPNDETWMIFVRRFGNEGFCSSHIHYLDYLPNNQFIFRLPLDWGANATLASQDVNFTPDSPSVTFVPGQGVLVDFSMTEDPAARQLESGEIHLHWNNADTSALRRKKIAIVREQEPAEKEAGTEEYYQELVEKMTPAQKAQLSKMVPHADPLPKPAPHLNAIHSVAVVGRLPYYPPQTRHPSVSSVLDPAKVQSDDLLVQAIHTVAHLPPPTFHAEPKLRLEPVMPITRKEP